MSANNAWWHKLHESSEYGSLHWGLQMSGWGIQRTYVERNAIIISQWAFKLLHIYNDLSGGLYQIFDSNSISSGFICVLLLFLQLYLQARLNWRGSKLMKHVLQYICVMTAWYTSLSRISDYKHHWSDVLAGAALGVFGALIIVSVNNKLPLRFVIF